MFASHLDVLRNLGALSTAHFTFQRLRNRILPPEFLRVRSRYARYPLTCRRGTSDLEVFGQVFSHREYACLDHVGSAHLVIDCGANVGFSSAYFASRFPEADVVAVEPDHGNYAQLVANLSPYGSRIRTVRAGVWWRPAGLMVDDFPGGDGREWGRCVREAQPHEIAEVQALDIASLLELTGHERISVLKVDIEGGELELFAHQCTWLVVVDNLVIETHGPACELAVVKAATEHGLRMSRFNDELMVGMRQGRST